MQTMAASVKVRRFVCTAIQPFLDVLHLFIKIMLLPPLFLINNSDYSHECESHECVRHSEPHHKTTNSSH